MLTFYDNFKLNQDKIKCFDSVVDSNTVEQLLNLAKASKKSSATVGSIKDNEYIKEVYKDFCSAKMVDYSAYESLVNMAVHQCMRLAEESFNVECILQQIDFLYYNNNANYWPHIDGQIIEGSIAKRASINRDISCILYLNNDYLGGELHFNLLKKTFRPNSGQVIMFPSSWEFLHQVNSVQGERYALVMWFQSTPYLFNNEIIDNPEVLHHLNQYSNRE